MFDLTPSEIPIGQVLVPPALVATLLGFFATSLLARILNRLQLSRFFWHPAVAFLSIWAILGSLIGLILIAFRSNGP